MKTLTFTGFLLFFISNAILSQTPGELDLTFGDDGISVYDFDGKDETVLGIAVQDDGKIITVGYTYNDVNRDCLITRHLENGDLDMDFGIGGKIISDFGFDADTYADVIIRDGGKFLCAGYLSNATDYDFLLTQYNEDGTLDTDFGTDAGMTVLDVDGDDVLRSIRIDGEGRIVVAATTGDGAPDCAVVRYTENGIPDPTFSSDGCAQISGFGFSSDITTELIILPDNKIAVCGITFTGLGNRFAVMRLNENGTMDNSFSGDGIDVPDFGTALEAATGIFLQGDKLLVGGDVFTGNINLGFVRYNDDGTLDNSFSTDGKLDIDITGTTEYSGNMILQPDGKFLIGGYTWNGENFDALLTRLNADLTPDETFGTDGYVITGVGDTLENIWETVLQPDGKIICGGTTHNGLNYDYLMIRYNSGLEVGIENTEVVKPEYLLFPNPMSEVANLEFENPLHENHTFLLFNAKGELVQAINNVSGENMEISKGKLPTGLYFFQLENEGYIKYSGKLMIE